MYGKKLHSSCCSVLESKVVTVPKKKKKKNEPKSVHSFMEILELDSVSSCNMILERKSVPDPCYLEVVLFKYTSPNNI